MLALRVDAPCIVEKLQVYLTRDPQPSRKLLEMELGTGVTSLLADPSQKRPYSA
jgi:hypothetical protein